MRAPRTIFLSLALLLFALPVHADPVLTSRLSWVTDGHVQAAVQVGQTLYIGGTFTSVSPAAGGDAVPRTNLAAFDLQSNTLLSWAPATVDSVTRLAAADHTVFVGARRLTPSNGLQPFVWAVDGDSGAELPWSLPPTHVGGARLLGVVGSHVYVSGYFTDGTLLRLDAATGSVDPGWRPPGVIPYGERVTHMVVSGDTLFVAGGATVAALDLATGAVSPWHTEAIPPRPGPPPYTFSSWQVITGLTIDGRTLHVAVSTRYAASKAGSIVSIDSVTGLQTSFTATPGEIGDLAVADGQVIAALNGRTSPSVAGDDGVIGFSANGQAAWNPGYTFTGTGLDDDPGILVTDTDIVLLGYHATSPVPVGGVAVLPRRPAAAPIALTATVVDNLVSLAWTAPMSPPSGYIVDVGSVAGATDTLSVPTGSIETSLSVNAGNGRYYVRVRAADAPTGAAAVPTNEIALIVGCSAPPAALPTRLSAQVNGPLVTLTWNAPPFAPVSGYVVEAGATPGASTISLPLTGGTTSFSVVAPDGRYYVRVRARNSCGVGAASDKIFFTVGGPNVPEAPQHVSAQVEGDTVTLTWDAVPGAAGYQLEAGTAPGLTDAAKAIVTAPTFTVSGVPAGYYYVRVRAGTAASVSAPSAELAVVVIQ